MNDTLKYQLAHALDQIETDAADAKHYRAIRDRKVVIQYTRTTGDYVWFAIKVGNVAWVEGPTLDEAIDKALQE